MQAESLSSDEQDALLTSLGRMGQVTPCEQPVFTPLASGVSSLIVKVDAAAGTFQVKRALLQLKVAAFWEAQVERNCAAP